MNLFNNLKVYATKWEISSERSLSNEEIQSVSSAVVVAGAYGNSVCFHMVKGGQTYLPLDTRSTVSVGDTIDVKKAKIVTFSKEGADDIHKVLA